MSNIVKSLIKVSDLKAGMTVEVGGKIRTVNAQDIKVGFCGHSYLGDASKKEIVQVQFLVPTAFGNVLR